MANLGESDRDLVPALAWVRRIALAAGALDLRRQLHRARLPSRPVGPAGLQQHRGHRAGEHDREQRGGKEPVLAPGEGAPVRTAMKYVIDARIAVIGHRDDGRLTFDRHPDSVARRHPAR